MNFSANDPAFPMVTVERDAAGKSLPGLSKREYFAGLAMQKIAHEENAERCAIVAVKYADALMAQLAKVNT